MPVNCQRLFLTSILLAGVAVSAFGAKHNARTPSSLSVRDSAKLLSSWSALPLVFEENRGQTAAQVRFLARQGSSLIFLTSSGAVISLPGAREFAAMEWKGANPTPVIEGVDRADTGINYFTGSDKQSWLTGVPGYTRVRYKDIYPGIDLIYYGYAGQIEYDLIVNPGADPRAIRLSFSHASGVDIDPDTGDLLIRTGSNTIYLRNPGVYQESPAGGGAAAPIRKRIAAHYIRTGPNEFGFALGAYDRDRALVIDPELNYSSYIGGHLNDSGGKVVVDADGNAYIVGATASPDFPLVSPLQNSAKGTNNGFVAKINPELPGLSSIVWSTYLGGSGVNVARGVAVDSGGNVYVVGDTTASNFPVTPGAYQTTCKMASGSCTTDVFVSKIDPSGAALLYSTLLGGTGKEFGFMVAVDPNRRIYVGANTGSADLPTTPGAPQRAFAGGGASGSAYADAYVAILDPAGQGASDLVYATYLGGSGSEQLWGLAVDSAGAAYVTGSTTSQNFPLTPSAYQSAYRGAGALALGDAFVSKIVPAGAGPADLAYSTLLGGANDDRGESIAVDPLGHAYVTGITASTAFPVTAQTAFQAAFGGGSCGGIPCDDAFIVEIDPSLSGAASLVYSSYFGGAGMDLGHGIGLDSNGLVYITGETGSTNLALKNPIQSQCYGGCTPTPMDDVMIAKFDLSVPGTGSLLFSTYLGGNDVDTGWGIAVDSKGDAIVTGQTYSTNFPLAMPLQNMCNGCSPFKSSSPSGDSFLIKVCIADCPALSASVTTLNFTSQLTGTSSQPAAVTFTNTGTGDLTIAGISIAGANAADFEQTNNCPAVLGPALSCQVTVTFMPSASGARAASLTLSNNASPSPAAVSLTGTGVAPSQVGLSASTIAFPSQNSGTTSAAQTVIVTNNGPGSLAMALIAIGGANPGDFGQANNCPASLAVNISCSINVTFSPTAAGSRSALLVITDNGIASPQSVSLTGAGVVPAPQVGFSTSALIFASQNTGTTSAVQSVTLTNKGPGTLSIASIGIAGAAPADFAQMNNCPAMLALNASCSVSVTFTPAAAGSRSGALVITDNGIGSPQSIGLSGAGVAPGPVLWPNGYAFKAAFTVNAGMAPSAVSGFPALISGTFPDFRTIANGGRVANTCSQIVGNRIIATPCDLIFTSDAAGTALLNWEFESYNPLTGATNIWVRVPSLASGASVYAWYGNAAVTALQTVPASTWDAKFLAVYHLSEDPGGAAPQFNDSTANANHATGAGAIASAALLTGVVGNGIAFNGYSQFAVLGNPQSFSFERTDSWSVSAWVRPAANTFGSIVSKQNGSTPFRGWELFQRGGTAKPTFAFEVANQSSVRLATQTSAAFATGAFHYIVATYSGNSTTSGVSLYVDGAAQGKSDIENNLNATIVTTTAPDIAARDTNSSMPLNATLDEIRVYAKGVVLSPGWVAAEYNNQNNPSTFFSVVTGITNGN